MKQSKSLQVQNWDFILDWIPAVTGTHDGGKGAGVAVPPANLVAGPSVSRSSPLLELAVWVVLSRAKLVGPANIWRAQLGANMRLGGSRG